MNNFNSNQVWIGGEATAIVNTLREYGQGKAVPTRLVARLVGRGREEIRGTLKALEDQGIVKLEQNGNDDFVTLKVL